MTTSRTQLVIPVDHAPTGRTQGSLGWSHVGARTVQADPGASREATAGDASRQPGLAQRALSHTEKRTIFNCRCPFFINPLGRRVCPLTLRGCAAWPLRETLSRE